MTEISPLRRRIIEDMTVRNLSPATQRSYVHAVGRFCRFFGRAPDRLGLEDVRTFQVHLVAGGISWPALNQTVCALRFLYGVTLKQADLPERIPYARTPCKLPVVLGAGEVVRFLERSACRLMIGLLALAHDRACEAELAAALDAILDGGDLPELAVLQQRFMPSAASVPMVTVLLPAAIAYDALLGAPVAWVQQ